MVGRSDKALELIMKLSKAKLLLTFVSREKK